MGTFIIFTFVIHTFLPEKKRTKLKFPRNGLERKSALILYKLVEDEKKVLELFRHITQCYGYAVEWNLAAQGTSYLSDTSTILEFTKNHDLVH